MPRKPLHENANDQQLTVLDKNNDRTPILIFISAQALGHLGLAVSIFAIWFGWLLPASVTTTIVPEGSEIKKAKPRLPSRHVRRSTIDAGRATIPPPTPIRRASAPVNLTPILVPHPEDVQTNSRRVYFTDSPPAPIIRRNTIPEQKSNDIEQLVNQAVLSSASGSPRSSTSTLPTPPAPPSLDGLEEVVHVTHDSDSSPHSSKASLPKPASRLQKFKLGFHGKGHRPEPLEKLVDQASIASTETTVSEPGKRASGGIVAGWTLSRNKTAPDVTAIESASPSPSRLSFARRMSPSRPATSPATPNSGRCNDCLSPTFISRKAQKRVSAPIPRTSPYGAPYFATPPLLVNNDYPAYLKGLPQFEDEIHSVPSHASDGEDMERHRGRTSSIRRVKLNAAPRVPTNRRSASVDWTPRQESNL
ncbi:hypothetical protein CVT25_014836 [Psilocybe cyanescens]|uniref:Uncharacterized protein n=1 Tax=Psilocybe cyanescens TaxID=93625 RepID=A0A409WES6_PSICY|nr:hypothetical protein CVT25_014836 [Psilocybe cyanescens]